MTGRITVQQLRPDLSENLFRVDVAYQAEAFGHTHATTVYMRADELEAAWEQFDRALTLYRASRRSLPGAQPTTRLGRGADVP